MADPNADNAALAVDELKRKARRRLIGAVVLALAAATLLPLLLEQEQKPLGDDVSVQIPPVDEGKFVSRLTGADKGGEPPPAPRADSRAEGKIAVRPEGRGDAQTAPKADAKVEPKADATAEPKADAKAAPKADPRPETKADARTDATAPAETIAGPGPAAATATPEERPKPEGFVVQLGAYTDAYGANALSNKLKRAGYPAYTEPTESSRGTLWRVRVGGYPSRAAANEARDRLKADGHNGIVSAAK